MFCMFIKDFCFLCAHFQVVGVFLKSWVARVALCNDLASLVNFYEWKVNFCNFFAFVVFSPVASSICWVVHSRWIWMEKASVSSQITDDLLDQPGHSGCPSNYLETLLLAVSRLHFRPKSLRMKLFAHCNDTLNQHHWKIQNPAHSCALGSIHHHLLDFICSKPDFSENWTDLVSLARENSVRAANRVNTSSSKSHKANPEPSIPRGFLISWSKVLSLL